MPAYFVDLYGSPKSSKTEKKWSFFVEKRGAISVEGQFSVRDFRKGDLRAVAVFEIPSLKLVGVRLHLPRKWTAPQVEAALNAYGNNWKSLEKTFGINTWLTPDGAKAVSMLNYMEFQSPEIVETARKVVERDKAQRNAVPEF